MDTYAMQVTQRFYGKHCPRQAELSYWLSHSERHLFCKQMLVAHFL